MEFRILGPLEASAESGPLKLGGAKQRALLGALLLHANERVSVQALVNELWGVLLRRPRAGRSRSTCRG